MNLLHAAILVAIATAGLNERSDKAKRVVRSITVVGKGEISARPDVAELQVGVVTQAKSAAQALDENNKAMHTLFETLKARDIAEKDLQTSSFNVTPQYRHDERGGRRPEIVGYEVVNMVRIKVRKIGSLGEVLDEVIRKGANQLYGIGYTVSEPERLLDDARRRALADSRRKAELYANEAGVKVGRVLLIQEHSAQIPRPEMLGVARMAAMESVPVAPGEQEMQTQITVTYAIE